MQENVTPQIAELATGLSTGQYKKQCPECQDSRSKNRRDRPLSIKVDGVGVKYMCHHCGTEGGWVHKNTDFDFDIPEVIPSKPIDLSFGTMNNEAFDYLRSRRIAEEVIKNYAILSTYRFNGKIVPAVGFPYREGNVVNAVKWRSADESKNFSQENVCEDFYNLHEYVEGNDILICEGELDAQSWMSCDLPDNLTVLSIPNGAPPTAKNGKIDPADDNKFRYIWRAQRQLDSASRILINTDNDGPGSALQKEILRRIGSNKAWIVSLGEYKDANEALQAEGTSYLEEQLDSCQMVPIIGVMTVDDAWESVVDLYENGQIKGASTGFTSLDQYMQIPLGMLTVVTGFPASGKSDLIDQICVNLAKSHNYKTIFCSFEKPINYHIAQLSQKITDRPFLPEHNTTRMSYEEMEFAKDMIKDNFAFMDNRSGGASDIDTILDKASECVMRHGSRILVIDPYNYIQVSRSLRETDAISQMLTKVQQWSKNHDAHTFFIAHPAKLNSERRTGKKVVVTGADISGSHTWFSKADIGLTVWRHPNDEEPPEAHVWKVRWSWIGKHGSCPLHYDTITGRWHPFGPAFDDYDWDF
tara:strand:- start:6741 stop:8495 length:1755 start_codon:yes stop_codon:yes gene_type:complete